LIIAQTTNSADAMLLALKRWVGGGTLTSPDAVASPDFQARFWLLGLLLMVLAGLLRQGPRAVFVGLFDWSEARRLVGLGLRRLKQRPVVPLALGGFLLLSWTTIQLIHYADPLGVDNLQKSLRTKTLPVLSLEQGLLAALTPLRDLTNLADCWPLVAAAALIAFYFTSKLQWVPQSTMHRGLKNAQLWAQFFWIAASVWLFYRMVVGGSSEGGLPLNSGAYIEILLEPLFMLVIDAVLLSWILTELRDAPFTDNDTLLPNVEHVLNLLPGLILVNFLIVPGRYFAHGLWLVWNSVVDLIATNGVVPPAVVQYVVWGLSWGILDMQAIAFPLMILTGAAAWGRGSIRETFRIASRMLARGASTIFLITLFCGLLNLISTALISTLILSHPTEPWVLMSADSYCHYASLYIGLSLVSCFVQMGEEALVTAQAIAPDVSEIA
jgi:hypothetical protein